VGVRNLSRRVTNRMYDNFGEKRKGEGPMGRKVSIFKDVNYGGRRIDLSEGRYDVDTLWNDAISSLRVPPGMAVDLFSDARCGGQRRTITTDTSNVGPEWNDKTSSLIVYDSLIC
jgi:hypothetical protein